VLRDQRAPRREAGRRLHLASGASAKGDHGSVDLIRGLPARSSISRVEGPPEVVVLDSGVYQVCSVGVDSYDQFMEPR
jgi:hypothetical protein